jgi:hypothetical protein
VHSGQGKRLAWLQSLLKKNISEFIISTAAATLLFLCIPHFFFDDAGFILRYLDHFAEGYFFKYNINDPPVYGISGFIHGSVCGILCFLHLTTSEQALIFSNWLGFIFTSFFILGICKKTINPYWMALLAWLIIMAGSRMYISVASCGLETPLHLSFVTGSIYFFITQKNKTFLLFSAFMVISKLDAVPIAAILIGLYLILQISKQRGIHFFLKNLQLIFIWFVVPLGMGLGCIGLIFGSPLPQSAYTKIFLHTHPKEHWFPFLEYFIASPLQTTLLISLLLVCLIHLAESLVKKNVHLLIHALFGWLFIGCMGLYYFYNPNERMMWYYAMPELFLVFQLVYSTWYFFNRWITSNLRVPVTLVVMGGMGVFLWSSTYSSLGWLRHELRPNEMERERIGVVIGNLSSPNQMLFSGHGLLSRHFKGYVMDISGLNSKKATDYQLNHEFIIQTFQPDYIINHAAPTFLERYNKFNYELIDIYRDISLSGSNSWILLQKSGDSTKKHLVLPFSPAYTAAPVIQHTNIYILRSNHGMIVLKDTLKADEKFMHIGLQRLPASWTLSYALYKNGSKTIQDEITIPSYQTPTNHPSQKVYNVKINLSSSDSIVFNSKGAHEFNMMEPIYELVNNIPH